MYPKNEALPSILILVDTSFFYFMDVVGHFQERLYNIESFRPFVLNLNIEKY